MEHKMRMEWWDCWKFPSCEAQHTYGQVLGQKYLDVPRYLDG